MPRPSVIDLSHYNTIPQSLMPAAQSGIVGVIHKLTESTGYTDPKVQARYSLARDAGLCWGVYHFIRPGKISQQASFFLAQAKKLEVTDDDTLYVLDYEDAGVSLDDVAVFMQAIEAGLDPRRAPVLYSGHVLKDKLAGQSDG